MIFLDHANDQETAIAALIEQVFTESAGPDEGTLVGTLARDLLRTTPSDDLYVFTANEQDVPIAAVMFSRLTFENDTRTVFLLSPMAVATAHQGQKIGQRLISHGLSALTADGVDVVVTYGDPNFYGKLGFAPVSQSIVSPPQPLRLPHGWIAQSLHGKPLTPFSGKAQTVPALDDPAYW